MLTTTTTTVSCDFISPPSFCRLEMRLTECRVIDGQAWARAIPDKSLRKHLDDVAEALHVEFGLDDADDDVEVDTCGGEDEEDEEGGGGPAKIKPVEKDIPVWVAPSFTLTC